MAPEIEHTHLPIRGLNLHVAQVGKGESGSNVIGVVSEARMRLSLAVVEQVRVAWDPALALLLLRWHPHRHRQRPHHHRLCHPAATLSTTPMLVPAGSAGR
jgi:hypothetical protein